MGAAIAGACRLEWRRGRRVSEIAMGYESRCGRYRVDRVTYGHVTRWRPMRARITIEPNSVSPSSKARCQ